MKKAISMVMAAAMVSSLIPATAFAADPNGTVEAQAKVFGVANIPYHDGIEQEVGHANNNSTKPELQIDLTGTSYTDEDLSFAGTTVDYKFSVVLDGATFSDTTAPKITVRDGANIVDTMSGEQYNGGSAATSTNNTATQADNAVDGKYDFSVKYVDKDEIEITVSADAEGEADGKTELMDSDFVIGVDLSTTKLDSTAKGRTASVSVESEASNFNISNAGTEITYAAVQAKGLSASVRKVATVAEEEVVNLDDIVIKPTLGDKFTFSTGDEIRLKIGAGFEFTDKNDVAWEGLTENTDYKVVSGDADDEITIQLLTNANINNLSKLTVKNVDIEAISAKAGSTAVLKVYADGTETVSLDVAKVTSYAVEMSVDPDADVPVMYSGVDVENTGITDDADHTSLEVTIKETFPGAWNNGKDFTLTLPEGVYAVDPYGATVDGEGLIASMNAQNDTQNTVNVAVGETAEGNDEPALQSWFATAYEEGEYENFTFERRTWDESNPDVDSTCTEINFELTLVADVEFEGDVVLKLEGDAIETQEVTIAKFVKPYTVEVQQNDLQIDYRNTEIPTDIVIKEAEAGLWERDTEFRFAMEKIDFDDGADFTVDEKSGMEIKDTGLEDGVTSNNLYPNDYLTFTVKSRSDDEPATVTISGMTLYMERSLPAGGYALDITSPTFINGNGKTSTNGIDKQPLLGQGTVATGQQTVGSNDGRDGDQTVTKEKFINIITAGREDADSFTTKVSVPIGSTTITAGEKEITLDAPAYISNGYTMLPLRAVATALGIPSSNVIWNGDARTATVIFGSRTIVMTVGEQIMYVNGSPIPTSSAPEITNDRIFLPFRDLGVALGVSDITYEEDPATGKVSTVYFNANK